MMKKIVSGMFVIIAGPFEMKLTRVGEVYYLTELTMPRGLSRTAKGEGPERDRNVRKQLS